MRFGSVRIAALAVAALAVGAAAADPPQSQPAPAPTASAPVLPETPADDWRVLQDRGCRCLRDGDGAAAVEYLRSAVMKAPLAEIAPMLDLARAYRFLHDWKNIELLLAPRLAALDETGLTLLAEAYRGLGDAQRGTTLLLDSLKTRPENVPLWLALIDATLADKQYGLALQYVVQARHKAGPSAPLDYRAAIAYDRMGQGLGKTRVLHVPDGRPGQFVAAGLLLDMRAGSDEFLCCPPESAMYCLRRALDAGYDETGAHCLHARLWLEARKPKTAFAILKNHEAAWLEANDPDLLGTMAEIALACGELDDFLRYARLRADRLPHERDEILFNACVAAARQYNLRGDAEMSRELLRRAVAIRPDDTAILLQLADAYWETGEREQAAIWYRRVLERDPRHDQRRRILERLGE